MPTTPGGLKFLDTIATIMQQLTGLTGPIGSLIAIGFRAVEALRKIRPDDQIVKDFDANITKANLLALEGKAEADARIAELRAQLAQD